MRMTIFAILLVTSVLSALLIGDRNARRIGVILTLAALATWLIPFTGSERVVHISWKLVTVDVVTRLALLGVVACSEARWPSWIAALQGVTVLSHLAGLMPGIAPWVYVRGTVSWSWPIVILLQFVTLRDWPPVRKRLARWWPRLSGRSPGIKASKSQPN